MKNTSISPEAYLQRIKAVYQDKGNPEDAEKQMKYMRNQFAFYGLKATVWLPLTKAFFQEYGIPEGDVLKEMARLCYEEEYREVHYFAVEMIQKVQKKQDASFIHFIEELIIWNSWWDTVDWLAKLAGIHFRLFPDQIKTVTGAWIKSDNFWLQRTAIIFQLTYKEHTDEQLLYQYILQIATSKEFFLQKAAGWALRQYSKTNPESVKAFILNHHLAPLTVREGARLMKKKGEWN